MRDAGDRVRHHTKLAEFNCRIFADKQQYEFYAA